MVEPLKTIRQIAGWILCVPLVAMFILAGLGKLIGRPGMVQEFEYIGWGHWFRYLTGILELVGVAGLVIPRVSWMAALMLACIMAGAIIAHLTVLPTPPNLPAALLALCLITAWVRRR